MKISFKALRDMIFPTTGPVPVVPFFPAASIPSVYHTDSDIAAELGDGLSSSALMAVVGWIQRAAAEARFAVEDDDGSLSHEHEVLDLINEPNPYYSGADLLDGVVLSYLLDGNAYILCVRDGNGVIRELWYAPHSSIEPRWPSDGSEFISHYTYFAAGRTIKLDVDDVIHIRRGIDPQNPRKGLSPLKSLLREIWTDREASLFTAALLKNGGVPGLIVSPKEPAAVTPDQVAAIKEQIQQEFGRGARGNTLVMTGPTEVRQFSYSPKDMDLAPIRNISEERICALFGVPAAVVGFGTGLEQTKVGATMRELRQAAWRDGVRPVQRKIERALTHSLGPRFGDVKIVFDNRSVSALREDENAKVERVVRLVAAGIWTRNEARAATGVDPLPDDSMLVPSTVIEEPVGAKVAKAVEVKDNHTPTEHRVAREAPRRRKTSTIQRVGAELDRIRAEMPILMQADLVHGFETLGRAALAAATEVLGGKDVTLQIEAKDAERDEEIAQRILKGLAMKDRLPIFQQTYERHFLSVAKAVSDVILPVLGVGLNDPIEKAIIATAGTRLGLLDLDAKTKRAIFDALVEGRAAGLAGTELAKAIADKVRRGPWSSPFVRARVIARTETAFAVNTSTLEMARARGVQRVMILDARAGDTDEICEQLDGRITTLEDAQALTADEHPNGTRSFVPLSDSLVQEMEAEDGV